MYSNGGIYIPDRKPPLGAVRNPYLPINQGIVGDWLMNEGSGNTVADLSGNSIEGTVSVFTWGSSLNGPALTTASVNSVVSLPASYTPLDGISTFSVVMNVNISAMGADRGLFYTDTHAKGISLWADEAGSDRFTLYMDTSDGNTGTLNGSTNVALNTWYQVVFTYDGTTVRLYVNGVAEGNEFPYAHTGTLDVTGSNYSFGNDSNLGKDFIGTLDYTYLYNRTLSATERAQLYREPFCMFDRDPIELWTGAMGGGVPPVGNAGIMTCNAGYWGA